MYRGIDAVSVAAVVVLPYAFGYDVTHAFHVILACYAAGVAQQLPAQVR